MATMNVLDSVGATVAVEKPLAPGRLAAAASRPIVLSTEDKTSLDAIKTSIDTGVATALPAGEAHIGEVGGFTRVFNVTLTLDTVAYAAGDLIAETQLCDAFFRKVDGTGIIQSLTVVDQDDTKAGIDVYFLSANVSMGTENAAPSITDANAVNILGYVSVAAADYKDLGGVSVANIKNIGLPAKAVSGTDDLYVAVVSNASTPTYTASGVVLRIGGLLD